MKNATRQFIFFLAPCAVLLGGTSGCVTIDDGADQMQAREDMLIVQDTMRKLSGRIEGLEDIVAVPVLDECDCLERRQRNFDASSRERIQVKVPGLGNIGAALECFAMPPGGSDEIR